MIVTLFKSSQTKDIITRISKLGYRDKVVGTSQIKELGHNSFDLVYVVSLETTLSESWSALRVRLAQSNRFYIVCAEKGTTQEIVSSIRDGAHDFLNMADTDKRWRAALEKAVQSQKLWVQLYGGSALSPDDILIGQSTGITNLRQTIKRLGPTDATVLILGESGVGKERVAESLHKVSKRGPFIAVNCAAIPKDLIESELFGAEKGAFTGALKARPGLVEQASKGTLFLDEIGELEISLQPKLLRFLETRVARRVGGTKDYKADVRIVSATNRNLENDIAEGTFRADLYYRLSEITLRIPPLRLRLDDIPLFARLFMQMASERFGKHFDLLEPELVTKFQSYSWPGNVRELKSHIDRMVILYDGPFLRAAWWDAPLSVETKSSAQSPIIESIPAASSPSASNPMPTAKEKMERARALLAGDSDNLSWVAAQLGIHPTTLYRWRKLGKV